MSEEEESLEKRLSVVTSLLVLPAESGWKSGRMYFTIWGSGMLLLVKIKRKS